VPAALFLRAPAFATRGFALRLEALGRRVFFIFFIFAMSVLLCRSSQEGDQAAADAKSAFQTHRREVLGAYSSP
jgi:hypothetical protein